MKNYQFITLIILILVWIWSTHYILSKIPEKVTANILTIEYDKVGGMENYIKLNKIQRQQTELFLKQYEAQNWEIQAPQDNVNQKQVNDNLWNNISLEQAKKITWENTYVLGNPDAEITWVEYSDLECPFCKRLHESWTIEKILKDFDWKVNFVYKQFPLWFHKQAQMQAEAALCVWELWGKEKYYDFIKEIYAGSKANGNSYTKEEVAKIAEKLWLDNNKILSCIESWKFKSQAQSEMEEWQSIFGVTWTPWNVFINNKTWEWDKLPWAYPYEAFKQKLESLLSK